MGRKKDSSNDAKISEMQRVVASEEGKKLISMLSQSGALQAAMQAFQKGDMNAVQEAVRPVVQTQQASELLQKLNESR